MSRADIPTATWKKIESDPLGWRLRYLDEGIILGEPAWFKGNTPSSEADANHMLWDGSGLSTIKVRSQGQNPIEVQIGEPDINGKPPDWIPISECPYFGPVDPTTGQPAKPVFPPDSIWAAWN